MTEEELKAVVARYDEHGKELAAAEQQRIEERDEGLRRAHAAGWRNIDIEHVTGYSRETVRQALHPEARAAARKAAADRRAARQAPRTKRNGG